ncbi:unnamed protein product, partial [Closterium sp. NIES-65]
DLSWNSLSGSIPPVFSTTIQTLYLDHNTFSGPIPPHLALPNLAELQLANNLFTGGIPNAFTRLTGMRTLYVSPFPCYVHLPVSTAAHEIRLSKCNSPFAPTWVLSMLSSLQVANNFLSGGLPRTLTAQSSLLTLNLAGNGFTGSLPNFSRWKVSCAQIVLSNSNFTGSIPVSISTLTTLDSIFLNNNQLTGTIPSAIFTMTNLKYLYIANNYLSGSLPGVIGRLKKLEQIWLDNNKIEGPLPSGLCSLPWLWRIDVSGNSLYGRINRNFKSMVADGDALINLAHNFFFGDALLLAAGCQVCPTQITQPNNFVLGDTFDVLAGKCNTAAAIGLRDISVAGAGKEARVSVAGNCLTLSADAECAANATQRSTAACQAFCSITDNGPCDGHGECVPPAPASPSNFICLCHAGYSALDLGNGSTCAVVNSTTTTVSSLSTGAIVGIAVGCFAGFVLLAAVLSCLLWPRRPKKWEGLEVCEQYTLQQMAKATNNWAEENELGRGGFGVVRAMATLHHINLVRLLGFCVDVNVETGMQEQILVYEYVGNKDLQHHIFKARDPLSLRQRLRLAQGAAEGLAYLHGFATPIIHRDIKPANILVTADMHAKVADFGLLKLITHGDGKETRVAGTPGYVDPDYNRTNVLTTKCDVFSFGIVLLELLTGSKPIRYESHIRNWAMKKMEEYALDELKDSKLEASEEAIVAFADLALDCVKMPGTRRPDMKAVAHSLSALIDKFCPDKEPCEFVENLSFTGSEVSQSGALSKRSIASGSLNRNGRSLSGLGSTFRGLGSWAQFRLSGRY